MYVHRRKDTTVEVVVVVIPVAIVRIVVVVVVVASVEVGRISAVDDGGRPSLRRRSLRRGTLLQHEPELWRRCCQISTQHI